MFDPGSRKQKGSGLASQVLVLGGLLLLLVGGLLAYPYFDSRLIPPSPRVASHSAPATTVAPAPTSTPAPTHLPTATCTSEPVPTPSPTPEPTPTPTPALPTRILVQAIGVDAPVLTVSWETMEVDGEMQAAWRVPDQYAAGWHETSAPLGVPGNTVLNGHNTTRGEVFRDLYTLQAGDVITVFSGDVGYTYAVSETLILPEAGQPMEVRLENARHILPTEDERVTLVTCHPYGSLRYRLIVIALPVD